MKHVLHSFADTDLIREFETADRCRPFAERIQAPCDRADRLNALKGYYRLRWPEIKAAGAHRWGMDIYEVDWDRVFTPIEAALWHDIRYEAAVLYPQFPVLGYFADFANPVAKVAIECDGAMWHTDWRKDRARQEVIERAGWTVYRISGRDCLTCDVEGEDELGRPSLERGAASALIRAVSRQHGISPRHV